MEVQAVLISDEEVKLSIHQCLESTCCGKMSDPDRFLERHFHFSTPKNKSIVIRKATDIYQYNADFALIVIDATPTGFESFFNEQSVTRKDIDIAHTSGISHFIVAVSNMDDESVAYSEIRFTEIYKELSKFMLSVGIDLQKVTALPISASKGENVVTSSSNMKWWKGKTLVDAIDSIPISDPRKMPLRAVIDGAFLQDIGLVAYCNVCTGIIKKGMKVIVEPSGIVAEVGNIEINHQSLSMGAAGDSVSFVLEGCEASKEDVKEGYVIGDAFDFPPRKCKSFVAFIQLRSTEKITPGLEVNFEFGRLKCKCRIEKIIKHFKYGSETRNESDHECFQRDDFVVLEIIPSVYMAVEPYNLFGPAGLVYIKTCRTHPGKILSVEYHN